MKQFFAVLAVAMVFGMVACNDGNASAGQSDSTAVDTVVVDTTTVATDTVTAVEVKADSTSVK
jgi:hypothetical protein